MYGSAHGEWEAHGILQVKKECAPAAAPLSVRQWRALTAAPAPCRRDQVKKSRVLDLEKALKDAVNGRKDRHDLGRVFLIGILAKGDHGGRRSKTGRISVSKFMKVLQRSLRFPLMEPEAKAIFRKYGHDAQGRMPYELFARRLFRCAPSAPSATAVTALLTTVGWCACAARSRTWRRWRATGCGRSSRTSRRSGATRA